MINNIIAFSIKNKLIIGMMTLALIGAGIWSMMQVPIDAVPDITNNQVQVITTAPNLGTEDIEQFVTYPIEIAMSNLPGVTEIRSVSRFGLSVVTIVFEDDMGIYLPRQLVGEKLPEVQDQIPEGFGEPFMGPISTGLGEIYQYTLETKSEYNTAYSPMELRTLQDWIVRRQMAMVPGVVEVNSVGGMIKQYEVAVNPDKLKSMDLTITDIYNALAENNQNTGGAYIEKDHQANFIRGEGLARSLEDLRNIVVKNQHGVPILIEDIAEVHYGSAVRYGGLTKNGEGEAVGGIIMMLKDANSNEVIERVKERMAQIQQSLPEGVYIEPFLDRSELIASTTSTVATNLIEGGLIVIFILVLLLGNWRGGLIVASVIPLSLLFAFIMMNIFDVWANLMSLGAIDFGIIVDGAVIIVESVVFSLSQKLGLNKRSPVDTVGQQQMDEIAYDSSSKMMNSAFFGQLIILIVFAPILVLTGVEGKMFKPMALTFGFAMIGVMILCLTYVPMISALFIRIPKSKKEGIGDKFVHWLENRFGPILKSALQHGVVVVASGVALLALAVFTFTRMGGEFIPQLDEGDLAFHAIMKPGTSLSQTLESTTQIEKKILDNFPEVEQVVSRIGVADVPTDPMPMDIADVFVILKPKDEWVSAESKEELIDKIKAVANAVPGVNYEFTQPIEMRFNELLTGVREDIAVKLFGEDLDVLSQKADEMGKIITTVPGVADMRVEATTGLPQMTVQYNRAKLAQYGLDIQDLNTYISSAFAGGQAGVIFEGERRFDLVVRLDEEHRQSIENLQDLYVNLPGGSQIPLKEVADISYQLGPMQISRDNTNRRTYVGINVRGRDIKSLVTEIQQKLDEQLELPPGYFIQYGGAFENLERATERLMIVVPVALALIFILVYFALGSFSQSVMIYMAIPMAAIGGVFFLWLRDMPFSISAGVGFIVLFGVAVLNGLVLINGYNELKEEGVTNLKDRILKGTKRRIRPILLTASTDILGFLPMAISTSAGAEVQRPLATVVIGGMLTATLLTLVIVPVLYQWVEKRSVSKKRKSSVKMSSWLLTILAIGSISVWPQQVKAQSGIREPMTLTLDEAIEQALASYPSIKKAELGITQQEALRKTVLDLGNTQVFTGGEELGNLGSEAGDGGIYTILGVQQQQMDLFSVPAKSRYQKERIRSAERLQDLTEQELILNVKQAYFQAVTAQKRYALAQRLDSIYEDFEKAAQLRYEVEATSKLELLAAQSQYQQIQVMQQQAAKDYQKALEGLRQWIMTDEPLAVVSEVAIAPLALQADDSLWMETNPILDVYRQQLEVNQAATGVEKAELLPELNFQYGWQTINGASGFYTYQAGISIPLWFRPQQGRIQAARLETEIARQEYEQQKIGLHATISQLWQDYEKYLGTINYYQQQALPLSEEQIAAAELSYREGAIDYVTFIQNLDAAIAVQQQYLDYFNQYLDVKTQIEFITGQ